MNSKILSPNRSLELRRIFPAPPGKVFAAWTRPELLRQWWGVADGYTTPLAEVDLRVGGRYQLGMLPPDADDLIVITGEYRIIDPPDKLVFTWGLEGQQPSLISLHFREHKRGTELVLTHTYDGPVEMAEQFRRGWNGMFDRLDKSLR
jgi:uncharacterized protein YndB with AHSA1/START domain